jgi:hypothetical protein
MEPHPETVMTSVETRSQPSPAVLRARMIRERQKTSFLWKLIHMLGSLQLALILLGTIAIAIAVATFYESSFNAKIAQAYIYKAPWFIFWLGILCINLFAVTLTRWPWEKKHTGFIITHYGIITLLIGAVIGSRMGFEGNVTLHEEAASPVTRITTSKSILQVESPADGAMYVKPFDAELLRPSEDRPKTLAVPGSDLVIVTDAYSSNLVSNPTLFPSESVNARSGIVLNLKSSMAKQSVNLPLVLRADGGMEEDFFGLATIAYLPELVDRSAKLVTETQMVFANYAPVIQAESAERTGVNVELSKDGTKITLHGAEGTSATYSTSEVLGKTLQVGAASVRIENYWPDFKMENGLPRSISNEPNNPALIARVNGPAQPTESETSPASDKPILELAPNSDATSVRYQLSRRGIAYATGQLRPGETIQLGWADWTADLASILPKAELVDQPEPGGEGVEGIPGFRAWLRAPDGTEGPKRWVESGSIPNLTLGNTIVRIGYGLELKPIPFSIRLKNFEVPRFEGTETPANFIATVEFKDRETGATKEDVAKMNKPASWPGGLFAQITGLNYKFSQAEWNPKDLGETTLQVLYDPGWLLKWFGSLAICIGIFIMFYLRPNRQTSP